MNEEYLIPTAIPSQIMGGTQTPSGVTLVAILMSLFLTFVVFVLVILLLKKLTKLQIGARTAVSVIAAIIAGFCCHLILTGTGSSLVSLKPKRSAVEQLELGRKLIYALRNDDFVMAQALIKEGADVNTKDSYGSTPLHAVANSNTISRAATELLIAKGADVNARDKNGLTPLHAVASTGKPDAAGLLIAKGADINAKSNDGSTPLHFAARSQPCYEVGARDVAALLIAKGANINTKNNEGMTPLDLSKPWFNDPIPDFLKSKGGKLGKELR